MSLLDIAANTLDNFDPKNDSVNSGSTGLPDGDYLTAVESIEHRSFDSGWDCLQIVFTVLDGDHAGEKEYDRISFATKGKAGKAIPDFILSRSIKFVIKLGSLLGVEIKTEYFASENETDIHEMLTSVLAPEKGKSVILHVEHRPNKKDPDNPYVEYDLDATEQPETADITDADLPGDLGGAPQAPLPTDADAPAEPTDEAPF
ncbi:prophage protein [Lactiplantibacillus plantarum]|nr:prophage protein [Lactiplantibacillus plantarum]MCG0744217.1 prophage protein [Lactiplantibacillus plantarum]MCG0885197.1 prophage protein [Lactiplantibacillus plantarum]